MKVRVISASPSQEAIQLSEYKRFCCELVSEALCSEEVLDKVIQTLRKHSIYWSKREVIELIRDSLEEQMLY